MSMGDNASYHRPRVEDAFSEAGDRPPNTYPTSKRHRPPSTSAAAGQKAATARSASDSGYSSRPASAANPASLNGSVKGDAIQDAQEGTNRRPMPYNNMHRQGKESLADRPRKESSGGSETKKAKPKPIATRSAPGTMAPPPLPPTYQRPQPSAPLRPAPLRVNMASASYATMPSSMGAPPTPQFYQQSRPSPYQPSGVPQMPIYPHPMSTCASHGVHMPNYPQPQPVQHSYGQPPTQQYATGHATYPSVQLSYPQMQYPVYNTAPLPGYSMPAVPQRPPHPPSRHILPTLTQIPVQHHAQYTQARDPRDLQAMVARSPGKPRPTSKHIAPAQGRRPNQTGHRRRSRERSPDIDEASSSSGSSQSDEEEEKEEDRASPRQALFNAKSAGRPRHEPTMNRHRDQYVSDRRSRDSTLEDVQDEERVRLTRMEDYQRVMATPPRRQTGAPKYIEDTARATKAASPSTSEDSPTPLSPTHSRASASISGNKSKRGSMVVSSRGQLTIRQSGDVFTFEGEEIKVTIPNGEEERNSGEGSTTSQRQRRASTAGSNRTGDSGFVRRAKGLSLHGQDGRR